MPSIAWTMWDVMWVNFTQPQLICMACGLVLYMYPIVHMAEEGGGGIGCTVCREAGCCLRLLSVWGLRFCPSNLTT
jgi:hypothetical protein